MPERIDPYYTWLGIPPAEQPPDFYRLLGLKRFEDKRDVISNAADQRMAHVRSFQNGPHVRESQRVLNELSKAAGCLLNPRRQAMYDQHLRSAQAASQQEHALVPPSADEFTVQIVPNRKSGNPPARRRSQGRRIRTAVVCLAVGGLAMTVFMVAGIYWYGKGRRQDSPPSIEQHTAVNQANSTTHSGSPLPVDSSSDSATNPHATATSDSIKKSDPDPQKPDSSTIDPLVASVTPSAPETSLAATGNSSTSSPTTSNPGLRIDVNPSSQPSGVVSDASVKTGEQKAKPTANPTEPANTANPKTALPIQSSGPHAVPDEQSLERARKQFDSIFKDDLADAKAPRELLALADRLMTLAAESQDDLPSRFVMMETAHTLALQSGDLTKTLSIINDFARHFMVEAAEFKSVAIEKAFDSAKATTERKRVVEAAIAVTDELVKAGRFDLAAAVIQSAVSQSSRAKEIELSKVARELRDEITQAKRGMNEALEAQTKLASNPDDRDLNLRWGRFVCFHRHDWEQGLPFLSRGANDVLATAANLDRADPPDPNQQTAVGQAWLDAVRVVETVEKRAVLVRALEWMRKAEPQSKGLAKASLDKRIKEIEADLPPRYRLSNSKSSKPSTAPPYQPPREFLGMLGRVQNGGADVGVLWKYESGLRLTNQNISDVLAQANVRRGNVRIEFVGLLYLTESATVNVGHAGGSATGTLQLSVNSKPVGEIGGARAASDIYKLDLNAGEHMIRWKLSGEDLGASSLTFANAANAQPLATYHTAQLLQLVRESPTRARLNVNMLRNP